VNCDSWASCIHQRETLNIVAYTVARVSYWIAISHVLFKCLCCDVTRFNLSNWWRHTQSIYVTRICAALHTVFLDRFWFHIVNIKIMESMSPMIVIVMASNDNLLVSSLNNNDVLIIIQDLPSHWSWHRYWFLWSTVITWDRSIGFIRSILISCRLLVIT